MNINPQLYIISAHTDTANTAERDTAHRRLDTTLHNIGPTKEVAGHYKGQSERSILVVPTIDAQEARDAICDLLEAYNQECGLYLDSNRGAYFIYPDGTEEYQGQWQEVSYHVAQQQDGYTRDPATNKFYIIKPRIAGAVGAFDKAAQ